MTTARTYRQWFAWGATLGTTLVVWSLVALGRVWEPCANPDRLVDLSEIPMTRSSEDQTHKPSLVPPLSWVIGALERPSGDIRYQVIRSDRVVTERLNWHFRLTRIYQPESTWTEELDTGGQSIPVRWSRRRVDRGALYITARMDYLGADPIRSLWWQLLRTTPQQVLFGTLVSTSYLIEIAVAPESEAGSRELVREWLEAVAIHNREICRA